MSDPTPAQLAVLDRQTIKLLMQRAEAAEAQRDEAVALLREAEARLARAIEVLQEYARMPQVFGPARAFLASFPQGGEA